MATIQPTISNNATPDGAVKIISWVLPTTGDVGAPFKLGGYSVTSIQVFGSAITALALNGSNDPTGPTNWTSLKDYSGGSLAALAAAGFYTPRDLPLWFAPTLTTGTTVTVQLAAHRTDLHENH